MATAIPHNHAPLTVMQAAAETGGAVLRDSGKQARGIVSDTRAIKGGEAFVALRGEHHDAHDFLNVAASLGAALLVVDRDDRALPEGPDVVRVSDTLSAWGDLARAHLQRWRVARRDGRIVAITGSAGKTTTKQLCAALLAEVGITWTSPGNLNNLVGVPAVAFALEPSHRFAVFECGMSLRGEIAQLGAIVSPDVAVITNVSLAHAEGVGGTREDVAREKGTLFERLGANATCVYDADDAVVVALADASPAGRKLGFGRSERASYRLIDRVSHGAAGSRITIERPDALRDPRRGEPVEIDLPFIGDAAAIDLCAALAAAEAAAGPIAYASIERAMKRARNIEGRAEPRQLGDILVIDDTYNANPASMRAALSMLGDVAGSRRRVAVLGEMKELGESARSEHAALADVIAAARVALVIGCGGLASEFVSRSSSLGIEAIDCANLADAARATLERVRSGDVVLVKASRSVGAEAVVKELEKSRTA